MSNGSGFVVGFFMGGAMGAMAALLLAPKSGREIREELLERGEELRGRGEQLRDRAYGTARELRSRGEQAAEKTRQTAREAAEGVKQAARILKDGEPVRVGAGESS